jgi:hypothetical protein
LQNKIKNTTNSYTQKIKIKLTSNKTTQETCKIIRKEKIIRNMKEVHAF